MPVPAKGYTVHVIPCSMRYSVLREAQALLYNLRFVWNAARILRRHRPRMLYQRHRAFVVAGALLSRALGIPLVIEYQASEVWRVNNWDPCHCRGLLKIAEDITLDVAHGFVVLLSVLRDELLARGLGGRPIVVNPAAADISSYFPGCGGRDIRRQLGFGQDDVVVTFLGSFSYYHGIAVLQAAIESLLRRKSDRGDARKIKFLLIGDGLLRLKMKQQLDEIRGSEAVVFAGSVAHRMVPGMLDASDILVCPHVPLQDGSAFFGSPSKLFEYMAVGKAIIASNLAQLGEVLEHGKTALLVAPGSEVELTDAIELLVHDAGLRELLGRNACAAVRERHTWQLNARRLLSISSIVAQDGIWSAV